jgi:hypothetical protein
MPTLSLEVSVVNAPVLGAPIAAVAAGVPDNGGAATVAKPADAAAVDSDGGTVSGGKKPASAVSGASKEPGGSTVNLPVVAAKWVNVNSASGAQLDVRLPRQVVGTAASSVLIELPTQVTSAIGNASAVVKVTSADNGPAPAWVQYSPQRGGLVVGNVPAGSLPAQIKLVVGNQQFSVQLGSPVN